MDLQLCLPIAVKENKDQQLIYSFHIKKGCSSAVYWIFNVPSNRCEVERRRLPNRYGGIQSGLYRVAQQCLCENRSGGRQRV